MALVTKACSSGAGQRVALTGSRNRCELRKRAISAVSTEASRTSADPKNTDFGANEWLVDELYNKYLEDPNSVDQAWWNFFADYQPDSRPVKASPTSPFQAGTGTAAPPAPPAPPATPAPAAPAAAKAPGKPPAATPAVAAGAPRGPPPRRGPR